MTAETGLYILDPIHGPIHITKEEVSLIDTALFQRLKDVKQLSFLRNTFAGAQHARFEHAIGTMHLAKRLFKHMLLNQAELIHSPFFSQTKPIIDYLETHQVYFTSILRYAALVHDIGHGPYSHASEVLTTQIEFNDLIEQNDWLITNPKMTGLSNLLKKQCQTHNLSHETLGLCLIADLFLSELSTTHPYFDQSLLQDVLCVLNTAFQPNLQSPLTRPVQHLLHSLIVSQTDADRMDYLLRDAYFTGAKYGAFDLDRLLTTLCFTMDDNEHGESIPVITFKEGGQYALEYYLYCRHHMHLQIYNHKTNLAFEAMLKKLLSQVRASAYPLNAKKFASFKDHNFPQWIKDNMQDPTQQPDDKPFYDALHSQLFEGGRNPWDRIFFCHAEKNKACSSQYHVIENHYPNKVDLAFYDSNKQTSPPKPEEVPVYILQNTPLGEADTCKPIQSLIPQKQTFYAIYAPKDKTQTYKQAFKKILDANRTSSN